MDVRYPVLLFSMKSIFASQCIVCAFMEMGIGFGHGFLFVFLLLLIFITARLIFSLVINALLLSEAAKVTQICIHGCEYIMFQLVGLVCGLVNSICDRDQTKLLIGFFLAEFLKIGSIILLASLLMCGQAFSKLTDEKGCWKNVAWKLLIMTIIISIVIAAGIFFPWMSYISVWGFTIIMTTFEYTRILVIALLPAIEIVILLVSRTRARLKHCSDRTKIHPEETTETNDTTKLPWYRVNFNFNSQVNIQTSATDIRREETHTNEAFEPDDPQDPPALYYYTVLNIKGEYNIFLIFFKDFGDIEFELDQFDAVIPRKPIPIRPNESMIVNVQTNQSKVSINPNQRNISSNDILNRSPSSFEFRINNKVKKNVPIGIECSINVGGSEAYSTTFALTYKRDIQGLITCCSNNSVAVVKRETYANQVLKNSRLVSIQENCTASITCVPTQPPGSHQPTGDAWA